MNDPELYDVIIIGGGPCGSTLGAYLAKAGFKVALFEREVYPRFHIGESLLPFSMDIFREIGFFDKLDTGKYIRKYGAQFVNPDEEDEVYFQFEDGLDSQHGLAFEVERAAFDHDLLQHAQSCGVTVYQPEQVNGIEERADRIRVTTSTGVFEARFIADASGRTSFLGKRNKLRHPHTDLNNIALFGHYAGVQKNEGLRAGDITIGLLEERRWCWIIPFMGDRCSVGVVCPSQRLSAQTDHALYIQEAMNSCALLRPRVANAELLGPVSLISNYSHYCESLWGSRWLLVGDAGVFLDPIFSSGVHMAISSAKFAAQAFETALKNGETLESSELGSRYESRVRLGAKRFHALIRMFYDSNFVRQMKKAFTLTQTRRAFTSVVAGDVWNEDNFLFQKGIL